MRDKSQICISLESRISTYLFNSGADVLMDVARLCFGDDDKDLNDLRKVLGISHELDESLEVNDE